MIEDVILSLLVKPNIIYKGRSNKNGISEIINEKAYSRGENLFASRLWYEK